MHLYTQPPQREARRCLQMPDCYSSPCFLFWKIMQPSFCTHFHSLSFPTPPLHFSSLPHFCSFPPDPVTASFLIYTSLPALQPAACSPPFLFLVSFLDSSFSGSPNTRLPSTPHPQLPSPGSSLPLPAPGTAPAPGTMDPTLGLLYKLSILVYCPIPDWGVKWGKGC